MDLRKEGGNPYENVFALALWAAFVGGFEGNGVASCITVLN